MAEPTVLLEQRSRTTLMPAFLAIVGVLVLLRGFTSADTTGGRIVVGLLGGGLVLLGGAMVVYELRRQPWRLEIAPEHIVLWHGEAAGVRLGTSPPIRVQRRLLGGTTPTAVWVLADASGSAVRFRDGRSEPIDGVEAKIDVDAFGPQAVFEAVEKAGWPAEWRP